MTIVPVPFGGFLYARADYYGYRHGLVLGWWIFMWGKP